MRFILYSLIALFTLTINISECYSYETTEMSEPRRKRVKLLQHKVNANEDIYAILNRYLVNYSDIKDYNLKINLLKLTPGVTINIDKSKIGTSTPEKIDQDFKKYSSSSKQQESAIDDSEKDESKKSVEVQETNIKTQPSSSDKYTYHTVRKGETLYSLSNRYKTTVTEIKRLNTDVIINDILKEGTRIKVPNEMWNEEAEKNYTTNIENIITSKVFKKFDTETPVNLALLMPFKNNAGVQNRQFIEFYQGFLIGLDSIKKMGISVNLNVHDTGRSIEKISELLSTSELNLSDLIIGPVYNDQFCQVAEWAVPKNIPLVSPLAEVNCDNQGVFQIAPAEAAKYDKVKHYLKNKNVVYIRSIDDDEEFVNKVRELASPESFSEISFNPKARPEDIVGGLASDKINLFIVATKKGDLADAILSKLSSVKTFAYNKQIEVLGSSRMARVQQINPAHMFKLNLSYITSYHIDRTDEDVVNFDNNYISQYGAVPSLYAYRGYDIALLFLGAMKEYGSDFSKFMNEYRFKNLLVGYHFKSTQNGGYTNNSWTVVNYTPNFTILVR